MKFREEGDSALLAYWTASADPSVSWRAIGLRNRLTAAPPAWLREAVPGTASLLVIFDPLLASPGDVASLLTSLGDAPESPAGARTIEIPVVYGGAEGPDLDRVARHTGQSPEEVVRRHAAGKYHVAFMGFSPGFPYITGLPPELATPRLKTPRPRVDAGSVGLAAGYTGVYPSETAGGWNLIGRTALRLLDWGRTDPFLLKPGDQVVFRAVERHAYEFPRVSSTTHEGAHPVIELRQGGLLTTIQDLGRPGHAHHGVPLSGAMDRIALRLANLAAGNHEGAPALEFTFPAPRIRFLEKFSFVLGGADFAATLAGRPVPLYERMDALPGEELFFERRRAGHWAYLAAAGAFAAKRYLGSASADTRSAISGRLPTGAKLSLEAKPPANGRRVPAELAPMPGGEPEVRFIAGEEPLAGTLDGAAVKLSAMQDRAGYRTESPAFPPGEASMLSEGIPPGCIQLPPDGRPIFLMADRPTTGGYPKLAYFASIDTRVIAQSPPGTTLRFRRITGDDGRRLIREARQAISAL